MLGEIEWEMILFLIRESATARWTGKENGSFDKSIPSDGVDRDSGGTLTVFVHWVFSISLLLLNVNTLIHHSDKRRINRLPARPCEALDYHDYI